MRIAFDLDGVLADLHGAFVRAATELFPDVDADAWASPRTGASPPVGDPETAEPDAGARPTPAPTRRQLRAVWEHLGRVENFWETLDEIESGMVRRVAELAEARRWEVIFLTSRPSSPGQTVQRQTQRWLERHGFPLASVFVVGRSRGRLADALELDAVVDDRPDGCLDVAIESKAQAILVWRNGLDALPATAKGLGVVTVPSVAACLDVLQAGGQDAYAGGVIARLKRAFGRVTGASS